jgi:hypothetical protein
MKKLLLIPILLLCTLHTFADSYLLKAEKGIEAKIEEDTFGSNGTLIIYNKGAETVDVLLLKKKPDPETRSPITLEQFEKITICPGQMKSIKIIDTKNTIYGIGVIDKIIGEPYEIHGFKWPK